MPNGLIFRRNRVKIRNLSFKCLDFYIQDKLLTHSFPVHLFSTPWKQEVEKVCIVNEWVNCVFVLHSLLYPMRKGVKGNNEGRKTNTELTHWFRGILNQNAYGRRILHIGWPSHHLTTRKKSAPIQKLSPQIPKSFTAWKVAKYGFISGPYSVRIQENKDQK